MTTEGINVLAVLDCGIESLMHGRVTLWTARDVMFIRAAVSELAEAAREMNRLAKGPVGGVSQEEKRVIVSRMDAALARVGAP